jgi:RNA polymerase sigma-70 factor, ECF subfamily
MNASELDDPDAAVMRVLYHEHAAALLRYALRLTGDRARAEDVVQETLLRAWQHPGLPTTVSDHRGRGCSPSRAT